MLITEATAIVKEHQQEIPVPVVALANALGAKVYGVEDWGDDLSGMLRKRKRWSGTRYEISVNLNHHPNRQRFTIAHEIAHIILHDDLIGDGILTDGLYRSGLPNETEWSANRYAGNILMPWDKISELLAKGVTSIEDLARAFQVSKEAMSIQLDFPWVREWDTPP